jgi:hypothetical protein
MLKQHVLSPLDDRPALRAIFGASLQAFSEIAEAPADMRLTLGHYHRLRSLGLTRLQAAYLVAAASGVVADPGIERQLHRHTVALREFAACPVQPDPRVTRHWSMMLDYYGQHAADEMREHFFRPGLSSLQPALAAPNKPGARPATHGLRHRIKARLRASNAPANASETHQ